MKSMKMSKKIKEEYKRLEGDPLIKQRQREAAVQCHKGAKWAQYQMQMSWLQTQHILQ